MFVRLHSLSAAHVVIDTAETKQRQNVGSDDLCAPYGVLLGVASGHRHSNRQSGRVGALVAHRGSVRRATRVLRCCV